MAHTHSVDCMRMQYFGKDDEKPEGWYTADHPTLGKGFKIEGGDSYEVCSGEIVRADSSKRSFGLPLFLTQSGFVGVVRHVKAPQ